MPPLVFIYKWKGGLWASLEQVSTFSGQIKRFYPCHYSMAFAFYSVFCPLRDREDCFSPSRYSEDHSHHPPIVWCAFYSVVSDRIGFTKFRRPDLTILLGSCSTPADIWSFDIVTKRNTAHLRKLITLFLRSLKYMFTFVNHKNLA